MNTMPTPGTVQPSTRFSGQVGPQPMRRQPSKDQNLDGPALPQSASWANKDAVLNRTRRASLAGSQASQSPRTTQPTVAAPADESKRPEKQPQQVQRTPSPAHLPQSAPRSAAPDPAAQMLENLVSAVNSPAFKFNFSPAGLSAEELAFIEQHASLIDPFGGAKRRVARERAEQDRARREQELLQTVAAEDENRESGSLQLGGEPDDAHPPGPRSSRDSHGAIQPPSQQGTRNNSTVGSPVSATSQQFQGLNLGGRSLTPLQQQQLMLLKSANSQQAGLADPLQGNLNPSLDPASLARQGFSQAQIAHITTVQAQNRQAGKNLTNLNMRMPNGTLVQPGTPNPLAAPASQTGLAGAFYTSGVQGPPPGLKTAGTPPISGGGMFAQGHGFTSNNNIGLGGNVGKHENNPELMRELLRGRSGTGAGGLQGQDASKREFMFPFLPQHHTPPPLTPANGLLSSLYGSQTGTSPEPGPQRQKKRGKKHRHANTSSGGGGVVDLADPSILQARMHQAGANAGAGQGLYGSQGQGGYNHSMMYGSGLNRW